MEEKLFTNSVHLEKKRTTKWYFPKSYSQKLRLKFTLNLLAHKNKVEEYYIKAPWDMKWKDSLLSFRIREITVSDPIWVQS